LLKRWARIGNDNAEERRTMISVDQRVGEYVLQERIGAGAFGQVWRARHHVWTDQLVAIKFPTEPQYLRSLQREGSALHGLVHPNIVKAVAFDPYADPAYLVMEYVPGQNLRAYMRDGRTVAPTDAAAILRQVLSGLAFSHQQGLVHRDVKPENILIHEAVAREDFAAPGRVKVTDFGLGRATQTAAAQSVAFSASLESPQARELAGTLDYMAPEQRAGEATIDGRADLYACGVVLFEMLTGQRPAGTDLPSDLNPDVPRHLDDVFKRSYARLDKRFLTATDMATALGARDTVAVPPLPIARLRGCPQCRQRVDPGDQFCMNCGTQLVAVVRRCAACGAFPDAADEFCGLCGHDLSGHNRQAATGAIERRG
jgi:serine/threonine protein kinase